MHFDAPLDTWGDWLHPGGLGFISMGRLGIICGGGLGFTIHGGGLASSLEGGAYSHTDVTSACETFSLTDT